MFDGAGFAIAFRLEYRNGFAIDIHRVAEGQVWYRQWPPDIDAQPWLARLGRMPVGDFIRQAMSQELRSAVS
jgi:hypothetical protein